MKTPLSRPEFRLIVAVLTLLVTSSPGAQNSPIRLDVVATDAPRKILHARLRLPALPGALTLLYPLWIPGEHGPSGWRLAFTNAVPEMLKAMEAAHKLTDLSFSLGLNLKPDGAMLDVIPASPADPSGLGPAMKLVAVNRRRWTPEILRAAIQAGQTHTAPLELLVENADYFQTCLVDYHAGEKYPVLERDGAKPDLLAEILKPQAPTATSPK